MKNKIAKNTIYSSALLSLLFTGCLTPYNEEFVCNKGISTGSCASVTQNYYNTLTKNDISSLTTRQKEVLIDDINTNSIITDRWNFFGLRSDTVEDWEFVSNLKTNQLEHIKKSYDLGVQDKLQLNKIIKNNTSPYGLEKLKGEDFVYGGVGNAMLYQHMRNEELNQKLSMEKQNGKK